MFLDYIKTIYTNPLASIKINGFLTEHFNILRDVKQGCPLSAILFMLCTEIQAGAILSNDSIERITIPFRKSGLYKNF